MSESTTDAAASERHKIVALDQFDRAKIQRLRKADRFFWLDLSKPSDEEIEELGVVLNLHPLAVEDTRQFHQRPKLDDYHDHAMLVCYGALAPGGHTRSEHSPQAGPNESPEPHLSSRRSVRNSLVETHIFIHGGFIVTIHREPCEQLVELHRFISKIQGTEQFLVYRVLYALVESLMPLVEVIGTRLDTVQDRLMRSAEERDLHALYRAKRDLMAIQRIVAPQREVMASAIAKIDEIPGLDHDDHDYFRDVYDFLLRVGDTISLHRELIANLTDVYMSGVANRQNETMRQLTIIATIFLPLGFVTGFFGMNFLFLTNGIADPWTFWVFGIGGTLVPVIAMLWWFRRRRWM